jgi:hypothetical protein
VPLCAAMAFRFLVGEYADQLAGGGTPAPIK